MYVYMIPRIYLNAKINVITSLRLLFYSESMRESSPYLKYSMVGVGFLKLLESESVFFKLLESESVFFKLLESESVFLKLLESESVLFKTAGAGVVFI